MKANQKEENLNGCAAPTKTESEGIDTDIEALETYICDNICQYREKTTSQEALEHYFCSSCEMSKHISKIKAEYDKINSRLNRRQGSSDRQRTTHRYSQNCR